MVCMPYCFADFYFVSTAQSTENIRKVITIFVYVCIDARIICQNMCHKI